MSIGLEKLTQILAKYGISCSQEEEILIVVKDETLLPEENKEESTLEESCISDEKYMFELEIEEGEERISGGHHANESYIKQWFQVSVRLDRFCFLLYFINSHFQHLIFHIILYFRFKINF